MLTSGGSHLKFPGAAGFLSINTQDTEKTHRAQIASWPTKLCWTSLGFHRWEDPSPTQNNLLILDAIGWEGFILVLTQTTIYCTFGDIPCSNRLILLMFLLGFIRFHQNQKSPENTRQGNRQPFVFYSSSFGHFAAGRIKKNHGGYNSLNNAWVFSGVSGGPWGWHRSPLIQIWTVWILLGLFHDLSQWHVGVLIEPHAKGQRQPLAERRQHFLRNYVQK